MVLALHKYHNRRITQQESHYTAMISHKRFKVLLFLRQNNKKQTKYLRKEKICSAMPSQ